VSELRVQNFRIHRDFTAEFKPGINLITGLNGSGKTSLIEAIYIALRGKSWRSNFTEITRRGEEWWRIDFKTDDENRTIKYINNTKCFIINHKESKTLLARLKKQVILFEPEDTRILYGSPARRRDFIDYFISEIDQEYVVVTRKYARVLRQRNKLLKDENASMNDFLVWNIALAESGEKIIKARARWIKEINNIISEEYKKLRGGDDEVKMVYRKNTSADDFKKKISENFARDRLVGCTSVGPHKDLIEWKINGRPAEKSVSRGEGKLILLTVFLILIRKYRIEYVIFDDLFNEIDLEKVRGLERTLAEIPNVFITDCRLLDEKFGHRVRI
jgi:DNA replication and repair protein RecF